MESCRIIIREGTCYHILEKALEIQNESGKKSEDELVEEKLKQLGYI